MINDSNRCLTLHVSMPADLYVYLSVYLSIYLFPFLSLLSLSAPRWGSCRSPFGFRAALSLSPSLPLSLRRHLKKDWRWLFGFDRLLINLTTQEATSGKMRGLAIWNSVLTTTTTRRRGVMVLVAMIAPVFHNGNHLARRADWQSETVSIVTK